jgi:hypothetical protein
MIASKFRQARHRCPSASCWVPQLGSVRWIIRVRVWTLSSSGSTGHKDFAVWKQCGVVQFTSSRHHRSSVGPSGIRTIQIDDLCGFRWISGAIRRVKSAWASPHNQDLTFIVHHCRTPIASYVIAIRYRGPRASASNVKVPRRRTGPSTEHFSIWRNKHKRIDRQIQMRRAQVAPRSRCTLPYLRLNISNPRPDRATDY